MKVYAGKWYIAIRIGDLCMGIGKPSSNLLEGRDEDRRSFLPWR